MKYGFKHNINGDFHYLSVPSFDETGLVTTCFTTRLGGVSEPPLASMNLGFGRGDKYENVISNYEAAGRGAGFPARRVVAFTQVHKNDVCIATSADAGEAFSPCKREFDAVITAETGLPIGTYHADCVPVFLLDTRLKVCGAAHAGWRGTALKTPAAAISAMVKNFGSRPSDILAAIGPSIGKCCFETDSDVRDAMMGSFGSAARDFITERGNKYNIDLAGLCALSLSERGISDENITMADECTSCNSDLYWSHRKTGGVRGAMMALIMLRRKDN